MGDQGRGGSYNRKWPFNKYTDEENSAIWLVTLIISLSVFLSIQLGLFWELNDDSSSYISDAAQLSAAIATTILAIVTVYSLHTNNETTERSLDQTKKMAEAWSEPLIAVTVLPAERETFLHMHVINVGMGVAKDVRFEQIPDFEIPSGLQLREVGFIRKGIRYLPPGQQYHTPIVDFELEGKSYYDRMLTFMLVYKNATGKGISEPVELDFSLYYGTKYYYDSTEGGAYYAHHGAGDQ